MRYYSTINTYIKWAGLAGLATVLEYENLCNSRTNVTRQFDAITKSIESDVSGN